MVSLNQPWLLMVAPLICHGQGSGEAGPAVSASLGRRGCAGRPPHLPGQLPQAGGRYQGARSRSRRQGPHASTFPHLAPLPPVQWGIVLPCCCW